MMRKVHGSNIAAVAMMFWSDRESPAAYVAFDTGASLSASCAEAVPTNELVKHNDLSPNFGGRDVGSCTVS